MLPMLVVALLVVLFFGLGVAIHILWIVAIVALVLWLVGFLFRRSAGRWYNW
ncbi:MAG TPA: hypothetical protein VMV09_05910 [Candidatus Saccharimonadales bacterium]|nr:hypothetical protein [Candidatus Saccharimonadales bacterium]